MGGVWDGGWNGFLRFNVWTAPVRVIEFIVQAVVDFLVDDVCVLCGRAGPTPAGEGILTTRSVRVAKSADADRLAATLCQPARHRYLGSLSITNHPICGACARGFEPAQRRGVLGIVPGPGCVVTASGASFVGCRPTADSAAGVEQPIRGVEPWEIGIVAPFMTDDNVLKLVHLVKFSRHVELTVPLGMAMAEAYRTFGRGSDDEILVPIPMRPSEHRRRGFNQATRLAEVVADRLGLPVSGDALEKTLATAPQSSTPSGRRAENVRGVFRCRRPDALAGRPVLLVDDLVTTGATSGACAAELLAAGARSVDVVCFARAL